MTSPPYRLCFWIRRALSSWPGGWKGYRGKADVSNHLRELYKKPFHIDLEYATEKIVFLTPDMAESYVNVKIKVDYGGFVEPSPFVMVLLWVKSSDVWKMATDIPIPIAVGHTSIEGFGLNSITKFCGASPACRSRRS